MVIPSLSPLKIPALEIHCSYRDTLRNKLEINSHTKIEIAIKCKSKPMGIGIVNKWQTLQNKHTVNKKPDWDKFPRKNKNNNYPSVKVNQ